MAVDPAVVAELRMAVADELARVGGGAFDLADRRELARQIVLDRLHDEAAHAMAAGFAALGPDQERRTVDAVLDALFGLGRLQSLVDDPAVENIDVNGADRVWITYADGSKMLGPPVADSDEELVELIRSVAARLGMTERRFDGAHPEVDLRLPDGSRLSALMSVVRRPAISIRRHRFMDLALADLVAMGMIDVGLASFLGAAVRARKNIVVGGAMNSGKTTLLRALAAEIPPYERIVTIEQAFELGLDANPERHPDLVALEAREANTEGEGDFSMARLVRRALRMNADRVIVGEVLGDEVLPMLNAMSQGRAGSMCTIHAASAHGVFRRIASYAVQSPQRLPLEATSLLVAGAIDLVVFIDMELGPRHQRGDRWGMAASQVSFPDTPARSTAMIPDMFPAIGRRRFVSSIVEVVDVDGLNVVSNEVFRPGPDGRAVFGAPLRSTTLGELVAAGYDPASVASGSISGYGQ